MLQRDPLNPMLLDQELAARTELLAAQQNYQSFLQQKAKINWIRDGDRNTSLFHVGKVTKAYISYYKTLLSSKMENRKKKVVFEIPGNKAPGPDGFSSFYFQDNWELVGEDVYRTVTSFFDSGKILKEINTTVLTMVPKMKCPNTVKDFKPIACCNAIYKIATKLLSSRIKCILPELVSSSQGGS
uniref:Reverse transcriptase n=1 Tax=Cannabis sativa TaxID=3483 RepID=A0A803PDR5_CANSA